MHAYILTNTSRTHTHPYPWIKWARRAGRTQIRSIIILLLINKVLHSIALGTTVRQFRLNLGSSDVTKRRVKSVTYCIASSYLAYRD